MTIEILRAKRRVYVVNGIYLNLRNHNCYKIYHDGILFISSVFDMHHKS